jgi:hypothetical protein
MMTVVFKTLISNQGWGISPISKVVGEWAERVLVVEIRGFWDIESAYRWGCIAFSKRRQEIGKSIRGMSMPGIEAFDRCGCFFPYYDMSLPPGCTVPASHRYFAYISQAHLGVLDSVNAVVETLENCPIPAVVMEMHSIAAAKKFLLMRYEQMASAVSAYFSKSYFFPDNEVMQPNMLHPLPSLQLNQEGQKIWGRWTVSDVQGINHAPLEVMVFLPNANHSRK